MKEISNTKNPKGNRDNLLFNSDNSVALEFLEKEFKDNIDVIYIDPPYNTKTTRRYSDNRSDADWIDFMTERLVKARKLMSEDGVIFISIDDRKYVDLRIICDKVFGVENFVCNFIWKKTGQQQNNGKNVAVITEYILCYAKDYIDKKTKKKKELFRKDDISKRKGIEAYRYKDEKGVYRVNPIQDHTLGHHKYSVYNPVSKKTITGDSWRLSEDKFKKLDAEGMIYWSDKALPQVKKYLEGNSGVLVSNLIENIFNENGVKQLKELIGKNSFPNPKPVDLMEYLINLVAKKDSVVLDFFAGSGSTIQSCFEINQKRNFNLLAIGITNNEDNIFDTVTLPRVNALINKFDENITVFTKNEA